MPAVLTPAQALAERRRRDLGIKAGTLREELRRWRAASAAGQALARHHSQVGRVSARMDGLLERIQGEELGDAEVLDRGRQMEQKLLAAHAIWDFFRSKFAQRLDASFSAHLGVCDEFAWACYAPVQLLFHAKPGNADRAAATREPPLVFLNAGWSPLAIGRSSAFQVDRATGGWVAHEGFREVVEDLPVPLIGLPWFHVGHLPDVLVVAHEVGHIVEWDFGLAPALDAALAAAVPAERLEAWREWRAEVFADAFGCLAGGAAFVATLLDFLAQGPSRLAGDRRNAGAWGSYPPAWLRTRLLVEALRAMARDEAARALAATLAARQQANFGEPPANREFEDDAAPVAAALLDCPCPTLQAADGAAPRVRDLLPPLQPDPRLVAENILSNYDPGSKRLAVLLAAARWVWERDPRGWVEGGRDQRIRALLPKPEPATRGPLRRQAGHGEEAAREAREKERGAAWFDTLFPGAGPG